MSGEGAAFSRHKYISLETYRRSGEGVRTPVWFVESGNRLYVSTPASTGKIKRLRNNPKVKVAICDIRGNVKRTSRERSEREVRFTLLPLLSAFGSVPTGAVFVPLPQRREEKEVLEEACEEVSHAPEAREAPGGKQEESPDTAGEHAGRESPVNSSPSREARSVSAAPAAPTPAPPPPKPSPTPSPKQPGFEALAAVAALGIALVLARRRA